MTTIEGIRRIEALLLDRLRPDQGVYVRNAVKEVLQEIGQDRYHPEWESEWNTAVGRSPQRKPFTDRELADLRVFYDPGNHDYACDHQEAVVIWTLLDMIEAQKGWKP